MNHTLKQKIEEMTGRKMTLPRDFVWLAEAVFARVGQRVSPSTLRRFWGYNSEGVTASNYTKDVLARFLGFGDFGQFVSSQGQGELQSQLVLGDKVESANLYEGKMLKLSWRPDRTCVLRHEGHGSFVVVQSENTRLAPGDTFECQLFIAHEPAYLNNWRHADNPLAVYVIGKKDGIIIENHFL